MAVVEELIAVLGYEIKGEDNLQKFKGGLDDAEGSLKSKIPLAAGLAVKGIAAFGAAAISIGIGAAKAFQPLENELLKLSSTAGISFAEMRAHYLALSDAAYKAQVPIKDAFDIYKDLIAQGQSPTQAGQSFADVARFATVSGAEAKDAAQLWGTLGSAFGFAADQAKEFFDIILAGAAAGSIEPDKLAKSLPKVALSAKGFLGSGPDGLKRAIAITEAVAQFMGPERAGTGTNQFLKRLNDSATWESTKKRKGLTALTGINPDDIATGKVSLDQFAEALDKAGEPAKKLMQGLLGPEAFQAFIDSWKNRDAGKKSPDQMLEQTGRTGMADEGMKERQGTMTQATTDLQNAFSKLSTIIGMISAPAVAEGMTNLASAVNMAADALTNLYNFLPDFAKVKKAPDNVFGPFNELGLKINRLLTGQNTETLPPEAQKPIPEGGYLNKLNPGQQPFNPNLPENQKAIIDVVPQANYTVEVGGIEVTVNNLAEAGARAGAEVTQKVNGATSGINSTSPQPVRMQGSPAGK